MYMDITSYKVGTARRLSLTRERAHGLLYIAVLCVRENGRRHGLQTDGEMEYNAALPVWDVGNLNQDPVPLNYHIVAAMRTTKATVYLYIYTSI